MNFYKVFFLSLTVLLSACSKSDNHEKHLPGDINVIGAMDMKSMFKKVAWDALFSSDRLNKLNKKDEASAEMLSNIQDYGVDMLAKVYGFQSNEMESEEFAFLVKMSESKKLIDFLIKEGGKQEEIEGVTFIARDNDQFFGITEKAAVLIISERESFSKEYAQKLLLVDHSGDHTEGLKKSLTANHDFVFWYDYEKILNKQLKDMMIDESVIAPADFKDDYMMASIDFEDGEVISNLVYEYGDITKERANSIIKENEIQNLIDLSSGEEVFATLGLSINLEGISNILKEKDLLNKMNNPFMNIYQTNPEELLSLFSGDMLYYVTGMDKTEKIEKRMTYDYESEEYIPMLDTTEQSEVYVVSALALNNEKRVKELLDKFRIMLEERDGYYQLKSDNLFFSIKDKVLFISNDEKAMKGIISGAPLEINPSITKIATNNQAHLWVNSKGLLDASDKLKLNMDKQISPLKKSLDQILIEGHQMENGFNYTLKFQFQEKDINSLLLIMELTSKVQDSFES